MRRMTFRGDWWLAVVVVAAPAVARADTGAQVVERDSLGRTADTPESNVEPDDQAGWTRSDLDQVVVEEAASGYDLVAVTLRPPPDGDAIRAMWLYASSIFDGAASSQAVLDFCAREGVNRINCDAYTVWALGTSTQKAHLRTFIATAHASGIRMEAVLGDTNWHNNKGIVRLRIGQVLALHNATPGDTTDDFDSIHFDAEFWLDSSWTSATTEALRQDVARNYLDNVLVTARNYLNTNGAEAVDTAADLSAHTDTSGFLPSPMLYNGVTQYFLRHVLDHTDDVVLMSYYDAAGTLATVTGPELDMAVAEGRTIQLGANIQTGQEPTNTFADNSPTPYSSMTTVLETFHQQLSASRRTALAGFSIFHYVGFSSFAPNPGNIADWDGDGDVDLTDYKGLRPYLLGPGTAATGLARDADLDLDGDVDLGDFALFTRCFAGSGVTGPFPSECDR